MLLLISINWDNRIVPGLSFLCSQATFQRNGLPASRGQDFVGDILSGDAPEPRQVSDAPMCGVR